MTLFYSVSTKFYYVFIRKKQCKNKNTKQSRRPMPQRAVVARMCSVVAIAAMTQGMTVGAAVGAVIDMAMTPIDIIALAKAAHARGLNTPEGVVAHLERLIARNTAYLERRRHNGQSTHFDIAVRDDNEALAVAVIYLEGIGDLSDLRRYTERIVRYTARQIASGSGTDMNAIIADILGEDEEK